MFMFTYLTLLSDRERAAAFGLPFQELHLYMCLRATSTALQQCKLPSACSHRVLRLHSAQPRRPSDRCRRAWTSASAHSLHDIANSSDHPVPPAELLEIGLIHTTHGVRGELKVEALTDFPEERLTVAGKRSLQMQDGPRPHAAKFGYD